MIFFAVASPTPGNTSIISSAVALFRSSGVLTSEVSAFALAFAFAFGAASEPARGSVEAPNATASASGTAILLAIDGT